MNPNFDPNKTQAAAPPSADPRRTQAMPGGIGAARTTAMPPLQALQAEVLCSREATMANGPAREQFLLELVASQGDPFLGPAARTPMNLCLVIDRSGSMEGPPLEYVKQACRYVVDLLTPNDVLSIVTFEETAQVLMPPQRVTQKAPILEGIARLTIGNTTNLYDGLNLGLQQIVQSQETGRASRLLLLTDGEPTVGVRDFPSLVNAAAMARERGATLTLLGFGPDYNEELLAAMAKRAGGNHYFVSRPELIPEIFRAEIERLMTVVARNLRLQLRLARWVEARSVAGQIPAPGQREFDVPLADLERGSAMEHLLDLEFPNHPLGWYRVAAGRLEYEDCLSGRQAAVDVDFVLEFTADPARYSCPPNPRVASAAQVAAASRAVEKTILGMKTQALSPQAAIAELQKTQALLLAEGRVAEAQEVTQALRALQSGQTGEAEKTLMGTVVHLDQGKRPRS
ncbi:MAG: VWA domain-containing protein [Fimbriimonadales bacterium]|nr:VWA domain-containing protein [Fimbriimonadales bacterium]